MGSQAQPAAVLIRDLYTLRSMALIVHVWVEDTFKLSGTSVLLCGTLCNARTHARTHTHTHTHTVFSKSNDADGNCGVTVTHTRSNNKTTTTTKLGLKKQTKSSCLRASCAAFRILMMMVILFMHTVRDRGSCPLDQTFSYA